MKPPKRNRLSSVLGLTWSDGQLRACHLVRGKGGLQVAKTAAAPLSLDVLHPDAELVGREIRNLLESAGIRERHCIVGLPPRWIMSHAVALPDLPPEDTASLLQLEAEKGFPVDPEELQIASSSQQVGDRVQVTQLAVRREQLSQLSTALKAAGLKPVSYSLGLSVLPGAIPKEDGRITISVDDAAVTLLMAAGGGVASFRTFEAGIDTEAGEKLINGSAVARELRITVEQVPAELRARLREVVLIGEPTLVGQLADALRDWARAAGLSVSRADPGAEDVTTTLARSLATRWLEAGAVDLEFLPPRPSRWAMLMARYSGRRLATAGLAVAALAVLALLGFGWQQYRLFTLRNDWAGMQTQVTALDAVQARIREYRPFYDTNFRTLTILKRVTECFPDSGSVIAKSFEIHQAAANTAASSSGLLVVTITGTARDNASLLRTHEALRKAKEVQALKVEQIRGKTPAQFTFTFRWNANPGT